MPSDEKQQQLVLLAKNIGLDGTEGLSERIVGQLRDIVGKLVGERYEQLITEGSVDLRVVTPGGPCSYAC